MKLSAEKWNELIEEAARSSLRDYQECLVEAVGDLGDGKGLGCLSRDIAWAQLVIAARRGEAPPTTSYVPVSYKVDEGFLDEVANMRFDRIEQLLLKTVRVVVNLHDVGYGSADELAEMADKLTQELGEES